MNNNKYLQKVEDRILLNLTLNAIKFCIEKDPTIEEYKGIYDFLRFIDENQQK